MSKDTYPGGYNAKIGRLVFALGPPNDDCNGKMAGLPAVIYLFNHSYNYLY